MRPEALFSWLTVPSVQEPRTDNPGGSKTGSDVRVLKAGELK